MRFNASKFNDHWEDKELSELGSFQRGKSRHRPRNDPKLFEDGKYPLIQTGEIKEAGLYIQKHVDAYNDFGLAQSKLWPENTLCITIAANIAETALLGYPMCIPDSVVGFNANPNESSELFMHYVFSYIKKAIQSSASGSIQDNINIGYLTGLKFKIPKKTYQEKIVSLLSNIDKKIELNHKINMELESMAKLIYDYWFVQFDFPDENGNPYKSSGGKMVYNETLKREIPEDWKVRNLEYIASFTNGLVCQKYPPKDSEDSYPVIKIKEMGNGFSDASDKVSKSIPDKVIINNGDVLFSWSATLDVMIWSGGIGALNQHIFKVSSDQYPRTFYYFEVLRYLDHLKMMAQLRKTTMGHITQDHLVQSRLPIPPNNLVDSLHEKIDPILNKKVIIQEENQKLAELRDWLLPMLMTGQVKINPLKNRL